MRADRPPLLERLWLVVLALALSACRGSSASRTSTDMASATSVASANPCASADVTLFLTEAVGMEPTLEPGDKLIVGPTNDAVGEIVVFNPPPSYQTGGQDTPWIKRVISWGSELERLAALHGAGALTNEEFVVAKRRLLSVPTRRVD